MKIVPFEEADAADSMGRSAPVWDTVEESQARFGKLTDEFELPERSQQANPSQLDAEP